MRIDRQNLAVYENKIGVLRLCERRERCEQQERSGEAVHTVAASGLGEPTTMAYPTQKSIERALP
jgi:hypothetical protein